MRIESFQSPTAGELVKSPQGTWAFVPAPLPPALTYTPGLVRRLSQADAALSELSGLTQDEIMRDPKRKPELPAATP